MAVKLSKELTSAEARQLAALLGEEDRLISNAATSRDGIATGNHCSVFYLAIANRYRIAYLSQHLRRA